MAPIHFGTSGWRDIIADGFTFTGVTAITRATARYLKKRGLAKKGVLIGHDPRFLAEEFTHLSAEVMKSEGIRVHVVIAAAPTPVLSTAIIDLKLAGGINFTASHNPAQYQGFKWSNAYGGPAGKDEVAPIEKEANRLLQQNGGQPPRGVRPGKISVYDPKPNYLKRINRILPMRLLRQAGLKVVADPLYGAGRGYLDDCLRRAGCQVQVLHDWRDTRFGGHPPEPNAEYLKEAAQVMKQKRARLALGTDGDADRFGVVDQDGTYLTPNEILALTVYLLVRHRGFSGRVVRSVVTSHLVDAIAKQYGLPVEVTPVGFKYIGESMQRGGFLVGGEESGGLTITGHIPEKDGILACLLMVELVAREKRSLKAILQDVYSQVGRIITSRINVQLKAKTAGDELRHYLNRYRPGTLAGYKVVSVDTMDGYKYLLDNGSWLGIRLSGTEPVARLYLEANTIKNLERLAVEGRKLLETI
ncbi:phosphoglucomutase/phosphomannomutase family protein [bacterium]|nr:phosphoglucomutase/phosphomannomutase family protein [bacterium]